MRALFVAVLGTVAALGAGELARAPRHEIENVSVFARLYGVVRFFYPSDTAANLDWNRFAVNGVKRIRTAGDAARLETALRELFGPLGPGIEIGTVSPPSASQPGEPGTGLVA